MELIIIILVILLVIMSLYILAYKRQIRNISRQMRFHKEHESNILVSQEIYSHEVTELIASINTILEYDREFRNQSFHKNKDLTEVITNLSHDIRTPLTSLDGYFQLLADSSSEEERQHYESIIESRIHVLKDLLEELFTYAKLQNADYELDLEYLDLGKVVTDTVLSFYEDITAKGLEPDIDLPSGIMVMANEAALTRVIQNIIKNCLVHGKKTLYIHLDNPGYARLNIVNDVEHPEEIIVENVFDRFYKADSSRSKISTGLGLSITKELVEKMYGTIEASKKEDLFRITVTFRN